MQIEDKEAHHWLVDLIQANWDQYLSLWYRCNGMVHGIDYVEARHKELQTLRQKVTQEYGLYEADPFIILRAQSHLFDRKSLSQCLWQDRDSLACWLADVEEAKQVQRDFWARAAAAAKKFFAPRPQRYNLSFKKCSKYKVTFPSMILVGKRASFCTLLFSSANL